MERETGLEPATSSLVSWHSTTELLPLSQRPKYSTDRRLRASSKPPGLRIPDSSTDHRFPHLNNEIEQRHKAGRVKNGHQTCRRSAHGRRVRLCCPQLPPPPFTPQIVPHLD